MKKTGVFLLVFIICFSLVSISVFAAGDFDIGGKEATSEYGFSDGVFDYDQDDIISSFDPVIVLISTFSTIIPFLFFPLLITMIVLINLNRKAVKKIQAYEMMYGVVFTKDVLNDMKNIPPQNYNYNPSVFVPVNYEAYEEGSDDRNESFSSTLQKEENENSDEGGTANEN